jgi:hypothetical protein
MTISEHRRGVRYRHDSVLELSDEEGRPFGAGAGVRLVDVSSVGVSFAGTVVLAKGARIHARLRLLGAGVLEIAGHVVRIKPRTNNTLYGIEFDEVTRRRAVNFRRLAAGR